MSNLETIETEAAVVAELADLAAEPQRVPVATGEVYLVRDSMGGLRTLDTDEYAATPRYAEAHRAVTDAASFVAYVNRHKTPGSEVYAHIPTSSVVAIIDSGWMRLISAAARRSLRSSSL